LGSSSTGFDPRQAAIVASPAEQQQQPEHSAQAPSSSAQAQPLFTWNLNQPQQQQQQAMPFHSSSPQAGQAAPANGFSFATAASNGTFVFGQSPALSGHAGAGDMTS
jgi:hypothetical protein